MKKNDLMKTKFDKYRFWKEVKRIKDEYTICVSKKPHARSAKRITILISNAYLESGGWIHWLQDLQAEVYRAVKERRLDCDPLEMESVDKSYICRKEKSKQYGKKFKWTQFENHMICTEVHDRREIPKATLFAGILTDYLLLEREEEENGARDCSGKRFNRNLRSKQGSHVSVKKKGASIYKYQQKSQNLSGQRPDGIL